MERERWEREKREERREKGRKRTLTFRSRSRETSTSTLLFIRRFAMALFFGVLQGWADVTKGRSAHVGVNPSTDPSKVNCRQLNSQPTLDELGRVKSDRADPAETMRGGAGEQRQSMGERKAEAEDRGGGERTEVERTLTPWSHSPCAS